MNEILRSTKSAILWMTLFFALILMVCIGLLTYDAVQLSDISDFTIIMFNFLTPLLLFTAAIILFLAFYVQREANDDFRKELLATKYHTARDSRFEDLKYQIDTLNNDIVNFTILHQEETKDSNFTTPSRSYRYTGVQALCCYLVDCYTKEQIHKEDFPSMENIALNANYLLVTNIMEQFIKIHNSLLQVEWSNEEPNATQNTLDYLYKSKLKYAVEIITNSGKTGALETAAQKIKVLYS